MIQSLNRQAVMEHLRPQMAQKLFMSQPAMELPSKLSRLIDTNMLQRSQILSSWTSLFLLMRDPKTTKISHPLIRENQLLKRSTPAPLTSTSRSSRPSRISLILECLPKPKTKSSISKTLKRLSKKLKRESSQWKKSSKIIKLQRRHQLSSPKLMEASSKWSRLWARLIQSSFWLNNLHSYGPIMKISNNLNRGTNNSKSFWKSKSKTKNCSRSLRLSKARKTTPKRYKKSFRKTKPLRSKSKWKKRWMSSIVSNKSSRVRRWKLSRSLRLHRHSKD